MDHSIVVKSFMVEVAIKSVPFFSSTKGKTGLGVCEKARDYMQHYNLLEQRHTR